MLLRREVRAKLQLDTEPGAPFGLDLDVRPPTPQCLPFILLEYNFDGVAAESEELAQARVDTKGVCQHELREPLGSTVVNCVEEAGRHVQHRTHGVPSRRRHGRGQA